VAAGGKRPAHLDRGFFFEPTVLDLPDNSNPAAQEEIFGPLAVSNQAGSDTSVESKECACFNTSKSSA
jgi:acyl-CoA reductase-like NAD-dependent aldehyde dehydrogenase